MWNWKSFFVRAACVVSKKKTQSSRIRLNEPSILNVAKDWRDSVVLLVAAFYMKFESFTSEIFRAAKSNHLHFESGCIPLHAQHWLICQRASLQICHLWRRAPHEYLDCASLLAGCLEGTRLYESSNLWITPPVCCVICRLLLMELLM